MSVLASTYKLDAANGHVSHTKMLLFRDKRHPREPYMEEERTSIRQRQICSTRTGWHCCCPKFRQSDFAAYGMGVTIYFQFLKYQACLFALMALISVPSMIFYWSGNPA